MLAVLCEKMTLRDKLRAELGLGANPTAAEIMCAIMTRQRDIENNPPPLPPLLEAEPVLSSEIFAARAPEHARGSAFGRPRHAIRKPTPE